MYQMLIRAINVILFTSTISSISAGKSCPIPSIVNGDYRLSTGLIFKNFSHSTFEKYTRATFNCNTNYTLIGRRQIHCIRGNWSHRLPECRENKLECLAPKVPKGWVECLTIDCDRFFVGSEAAIRCERGYRLMGSSRLQCKVEIEKKPIWSSPLPKCVQIEVTDYTINNQDKPQIDIFFTDSSSIMIIIIILSVLAGGLMLLMSIMLMNRLFQRRRLMRIQRSENAFSHATVPEIASIDVDRNDTRFPPNEENVTESSTRWNCFRTLTSRNSHYQHMDTPATEPINNFEQDFNHLDNFEIYNNTIYSDDQTSLIQPPCYEEAIKCSQYSIVASKNAIDQHKLKSNQSKSRSNNCSRSIDKDIRQNNARPINSISRTDDSPENINQSITSIPNTSMQSNFNAFQTQNDSKHNSQTSVATRSNQDMDNISRRSARIHCPRVTNNITSESFRSGSIETMAISDGTSVTVQTLDSRGSNPSLGSMRPQTGSIGDPTTCLNNYPTQYRHPLAIERSGTPFTEIDFAATDSRYSPPPSYECSVNNPVIMKASKHYHSNTASPSTNSHVALFVDNMACIEDSNDLS